ncbi:myosin-1-like [Uranotaenia lowii]|uniref:myosin-1-like n=1 Tax=Uranotaenia lowii TaxID=190385 RepID=UPI002479A504|nr:myosin-1-like [Uranotaenia lowii]
MSSFREVSGFERSFSLDEDDGEQQRGQENGNVKPTWHRLLQEGGGGSLLAEQPLPLLDVIEESGPESFLSDATLENFTGQDDGGGVVEQDVMSGIFEGSSTNYDSGNFSFSESSKEKVVESPLAGQEQHQRFVQLNTELYQAKTELLTYKYKWNEIRNEVESAWSKKLQRLADENEALKRTVEDLQKRNEKCPGLEGLKLRSDFEQLRIELDCRERANKVLKSKISEQYCDKERLTLELRKLEKNLSEVKNEMGSLKSSESWFRKELHLCQNENAKMKEERLQLENKLFFEMNQRDKLKVQLQKVIQNSESFEQTAIQEKKDLLEKLQAIQLTHPVVSITPILVEEFELKLKEAKGKIDGLQESNQQLLLQKELLENSIEVYKNKTSHHEAVIESLQSREIKSLGKISHLEKEIRELGSAREQLREENSQLSSVVAKQRFDKRDLDVSIGHLRAQLKVLSINFENTRRALGVKEFGLQKLQTDYQDLKARFDGLERCRTELEHRLRMSEGQASERYRSLLESFARIQSKNLDLELKLGQCAEVNEKFRRSEEVVRQLRETVAELQLRIEQDAEMTPTCPKHGSQLPEDDTRELKILLKVLENENRQKLKRYELNNRSLLQQVKEHSKARKQSDQRVEEMEKQLAEMASLQCEMARVREANLLLEVDLESANDELRILKEEKNRLVTALENSCLLKADEDIWTSFQRMFADLRQSQHISKENGRLKELLRISESKVAQLEEDLKLSLSSMEDKSVELEGLKFTEETAKVESDDLRSQLTIKTIQLEDAQRLLSTTSSERDALQDSIGDYQFMVAKFREDIDTLERQVRIRDVQLQTAYERIQLFEEAERILKHSRKQFFEDLQLLREEILAERQEKHELQEVIRVLREGSQSVMDCNIKNSSNGTPSLGSDSGGSIPKTERPLPSLDEAALKSLIEQCSRRSSSGNATLRPLQECVESLRAEMNNLNVVVRQHGQQRYQQHVVSLMEELQDATNGTYNGR